MVLSKARLRLRPGCRIGPCKKFRKPRRLPRQVQIAEKRLHPGGRAVFVHGGMARGLCVPHVAPAVENGVLFFTQAGRDPLKGRGLRRRADKSKRPRVERTGRGKPRPNQMLPHQQFQHTVPQIGQRRRADGAQIFPRLSASPPAGRSFSKEEGSPKTGWVSGVSSAPESEMRVTPGTAESNRASRV